MLKLAFYKYKHRSGLKGLWDFLVRVWTRGTYSHVELIFSDNIWFSASLQDNGVRFKCIDYEKEKWDIIEIPSTKDEECICREYAKSKIGCKYDIIGIFFTQIWHIDVEDKNRYFCNEIVHATLQQMFLFKGVKPYSYNPNSFHKLVVRNL